MFGQYYYTAPLPGDDDSSNPGPRPEGMLVAKVVGAYPTHGEEKDSAGADEEFSPKDSQVADKNQMSIWLGTPQNAIKKYTPSGLCGVSGRQSILQGGSVMTLRLLSFVAVMILICVCLHKSRATTDPPPEITLATLPGRREGIDDRLLRMYRMEVISEHEAYFLLATHSFTFISVATNIQIIPNGIQLQLKSVTLDYDDLDILTLTGEGNQNGAILRGELRMMYHGKEANRFNMKLVKGVRFPNQSYIENLFELSQSADNAYREFYSSKKEAIPK